MTTFSRAGVSNPHAAKVGAHAVPVVAAHSSRLGELASALHHGIWAGHVHTSWWNNGHTLHITVPHRGGKKGLDLIEGLLHAGGYHFHRDRRGIFVTR
jgi:hypothetical protein